VARVGLASKASLFAPLRLKHGFGVISKRQTFYYPATPIKSTFAGF